MNLERQLRSVGRNIKAARQKAGLRQVDVNDKIGVNYRHYQNIEAGRVNLTLSTLCRLSSLYGVPVSELLRDVCD